MHRHMWRRPRHRLLVLGVAGLIMEDHADIIDFLLKTFTISNVR